MNLTAGTSAQPGELGGDVAVEGTRDRVRLHVPDNLAAVHGLFQAVSGGKALGGGEVGHGVPLDRPAVGGGADQDVHRAENGDAGDEQGAGSGPEERGTAEGSQTP